ncbi:B3 domain-containing protein REM16 [Morus notabilis]|uniref:B3 domain-containing protein REM16 n=1 Tax=Morus notabilis TaxID=981085 RepID=W9QUC6_9ROSA|nr:B3 domain-containing protein REM16 [Morus notabilis]XP_024017087.1 B3 domain-containing protein REM16 [Morus notabilis]EXB38618.1 B3 domain-containing protein REM16 [Morus notabilis]
MEGSKWEEYIYWAHFKHIHFSQFLLDDFHQQLAIPKKFSEKKKLPDSVTLKGPGGGMWKVGLTTVGNSMFFKHGWQEFVNDHFLVENDLLVFRYNGESLFEVLIFDGHSLCEKEVTYFVKKHENSKTDNGGRLTKRKLRETSCDEINNACSENVVCASPEKSRDDDIIVLPSEEQVITLSTNNKGRKKLTAVRPLRSCRSATINESSPCDVQVQVQVQPVTKSDAEHTPTRRRGYSMQYVSNRRPITEDEKDRAMKLAEAEISESNNEGLLVVMKPTYVYKRFYVFLPSDWVAKYISLENQDLFLRFGEREWRTRFNYNQVRSCAGLTSGWKHFAVDNNLEHFDVCVFEPGSPVNNSFCLDVKIFRVVPEVALLTPVGSPTSGKRGRKSSKIVEIENDELLEAD